MDVVGGRGRLGGDGEGEVGDCGGVVGGGEGGGAVGGVVHFAFLVDNLGKFAGRGGGVVGGWGGRGWICACGVCGGLDVGAGGGVRVGVADAYYRQYSDSGGNT